MKLSELTPAQKALLSYMEHQSEERWCAGWLSHLEQSLIGDDTYEWLVKESGGYFAWADDASEYAGILLEDVGRNLKFIPGHPSQQT